MARTSAGGIQEIEIQNSTHTFAVDAEAGDAYAIALTPAVTAYTTGQRFAFKANTANTGAASLNVNGLGAITIKKHSSADLASNDIKAGSIVEVSYDGTNFQMVSMLAQAPAGSGDMVAATYDPLGIAGQLAGTNYANSFTKSQAILPDSDAITLAARRNGAAQTSNIIEVQTEANVKLAAFDKSGNLEVPTIELGHASDTTISRVSAGVIAVEGTNVSLTGHTHEGTAILSTGEVGGTKFLREDGDNTSSWQAIPAPEGTAVKSTGEVGGTKFLREDGDGTSSWQTVAVGISNVVEDLTPQLGGNLDTNGNDIVVADNDIVAIGTGSDLQITHNATNTVLTSATGNLLVDNTNATGKTQLQLGTDTSATGVEVLNNTGTVLFSVDGDGAVTLPTGTTGVLRADSGVVSVSDTSDSLTVGTIELGAASDTTIARSGAGAVTIEGVAVATASNTVTLSNKSISGALTLEENASIALDPAGSADGKYSGITVTGTAGAALAFGDLCYLDPTDSRWELADANAAAAADGDARGILGICVLAAAGDASATTMLLHGIVRADTAFPALTIGAPVYVSETAGDIVVTQPTTTDVVIRIVGVAITADEIFFNPDFTWTTHT
jgi:hypothetical protein